MKVVGVLQSMNLIELFCKYSSFDSLKNTEVHWSRVSPTYFSLLFFFISSAGFAILVKSTKKE
jgi:hypothetical protein